MPPSKRHVELAAAAAAALSLSACGSAKQTLQPPPALPRPVGAALAAQSEAVANSLDAGDSCGALAAAQQLQHETIAAINSGRVPAALQEQLSGSVNALVARVQCVPPPATPPPEQEHGRGKHKGHGKKDKGEG